MRSNRCWKHYSGFFQLNTAVRKKRYRLHKTIFVATAIEYDFYFALFFCFFSIRQFNNFKATLASCWIEKYAIRDDAIIYVAASACCCTLHLGATNSGANEFHSLFIAEEFWKILFESLGWSHVPVAVKRRWLMDELVFNFYFLS